MRSTKNPRKYPEARRFYVLAACSQFLLDSTIWLFYLSEHVGLSISQAVAMYATLSTVAGLSDLPTASWADRFGRKRVVIIGFCARAAAALLMSLDPSPLLALSAVCLSGFGWAQLSGALEAFLYDNLKALGQEECFKSYVSNLALVSYFSRTVAFTLSGFLYEFAPMLPYVVVAAVLFSGAALACSITERPFERSSSKADYAHIRDGIGVYVGTPNLLRFGVLAILVGLVSEELWLSFQPLMSTIKMSPVAVGLAYANASLGSAAGAYAAKRLLLLHREAEAMTLGVALFGIGGALLAVAGNSGGIALGQMVVLAGYGASWLATSAILNAHVPTSHRAVCLSLRSSAEGLIIGLSGCGIGFLVQYCGPMIVPLAGVLTTILLVPQVYSSVRSLKVRGVAELSPSL